MRKHAVQEETLIDKIRRLPPEKAIELEDFVDFLIHRDDLRLTRAAAKLSEKAFRRVWQNPDDAAYDHQ